MAAVAVVSGVYRYDGSTDLTAAPPSGFVRASPARDALALSRFDTFTDLGPVWATVTLGSLVDVAKANDADIRRRYQVTSIAALAVDGYRVGIALASGTGTGDPLLTLDPVTITVWPPGPPVEWATVDDVRRYVGLDPADATDAAYLAAVTDAANTWAFRVRSEAGYATDSPTVSPGPDVTLGVTLAAGAWYRRRGAPDGFAGWTELGAVPAVGGGLTDVRRLLGVPRPMAV